MESVTLRTKQSRHISTFRPKRNGTFINPISKQELIRENLINKIESKLDSPDIKCTKKVIGALRKADVHFLHDFYKHIGTETYDAVELFEDMVLGRMIKEGMLDHEYVSEDEIMEALLT